MEQSTTTQEAAVTRRPVDPLEGLPMLIPVPRAAQLLGISRSAAYRCAACGDLPVACTSWPRGFASSCDQCVTTGPISPLNDRTRRPLTCGFVELHTCPRGDLNPHPLYGD